MRKLRKTAEFLLDMIYPKKCPLCHEVLKDRNKLLCGKCAGKIRPFSSSLCMKCGKPVKMEEEYCVVCREGGHYFTEGRSIFPYGEIWRQSLVRFKYYGCREYGDFYAKAMSVYGRRYLERWKPQLIVPVPLHPAKKRMRGFNQAAYLAERLSCYTGIPWTDSLVLKIRNTRSQKKLDALKHMKLHINWMIFPYWWLMMYTPQGVLWMLWRYVLQRPVHRLFISSQCAREGSERAKKCFS